MSLKPYTPLVLGCSLLLSSCDDPELVKKQAEQRKEIIQLEGKIAIAEEKLKNLPPDRSEELKTAAAETEELTAQHKQLADQLAQLELEKERIQKEFESYKRRYAIEPSQ